MNKVNLTLITVIIGVLLIFTFLQMERPAFEIEKKLIVTPQNSIVANDMGNIINNIVNIASNQQNSEVVKDSRALVEVERLDNTSMLTVDVLAQSEKEAEDLSEKVVYNILKDVSKYYDVDSAVKINLVEEGEVEKNAMSDVLPIAFWALVGILISILVVMIVELVAPKKHDGEKVVDLRNMINTSESSESKKTKNLNAVKIESAPVYNLQDSVNAKYEFNSFANRKVEEVDNVEEKQVESKEKIEEIVENTENLNESVSSNNVVEEEVVEKSEPVQMSSGSSRSGAPNNLPIVEFNAASSSDGETVNQEQPDTSKVKSDEPTEEELKARLNKLLKGEM